MDARKEILNKFLKKNNIKESEITSINTDASFRNYYRVKGKQILVMDAPPEKGESVSAFEKIDKILLNFGLSVPSIKDIDKKNGFILLEDFGTEVFSKILSDHNEKYLYDTAIAVLAHIYHESLNSSIKQNQIETYSIDILINEAIIFYEWFLEKHIGVSLDDSAKLKYQSIIKEVYDLIMPTNNMLVLRDFHVDNLIYLKDKQTIKKVGIIDFQDALIGSNAYDLVSLLEDVRRPISLVLKERLLTKYIDLTNCDSKKLFQEMEFFSVQRNLKIIGIFSRLKYRDGKDTYMQYLDNAWNFIHIHLENSIFSDMKDWIYENTKKL